MSDPTPVSRRLVAVFAADVEGYSRLMGAERYREHSGHWMAAWAVRFSRE